MILQDIDPGSVTTGTSPYLQLSDAALFECKIFKYTVFDNKSYKFILVAEIHMKLCPML